MPNECCRVVLRYASPLTLGDEPLPCGMEHSARELGIGVSEPGVSLHNPVHCQMREQPTLPWQGCIQELLKLGVQRHLSSCCSGLQLPDGIGLDLYEPSQVSLVDDITDQ